MNELKKTIKKRNEYCKKISEKYSINLTTVKKYFDENIYCDDSGKAINFDKESFLKSLNQVKNNQSKRPHKTAKTALLIPNSFVLWGLIDKPLTVYARGANEASNYADYSHVIRTEDYYSEEFKICKNEMEKVIFHGFTFEEFILISAIYTAIKNNYYELAENSDTGHKLKLIDVSVVYEILHPGKRFDKATKKAIGKMLFAIISLKKKLQNLNSYYWCKGLKEAIYKESGRAIFELSFKNYDPANLKQLKIAVYMEKDNLLQYAENQGRILTVNSSMLAFGTNTGNNDLARWYLARRISIKSEKMQKKISIEKMEQMTGKTDKKQIKKYLAYLQDQGIISDFTVTRIKIEWMTGKKDLIVMNDAEGKKIKIEKMPEEIKTIEKRLQKINNENGKHALEIEGKKIETELKAVYCRNDWQSGGRFYTGKGGYQSLNQDERKRITIDGKNTVELDYSAYHPHLIYALKGIQLQNDPYSFYYNRNIAKLALNIAINSKNEKECYFALLAACKDSADKKDVSLILQRMNNYHAGIKDYFYSDSGVKLQNMDAEIALDIMEELNKKGIPCYSIHDSFIVADDKKEILYQTMNEAFSKRYSGFSCPIK